MIAVIVGATGLVGNSLLDKLLADPDFKKVICVTRKSTGKSSMKLEEVLIKDLSELMQLKDQLKGNRFFCCLGTTIKTAGSKQNFRKVDFDAVLDFAKIAEYHQAESFSLISAMGADDASLFFYNRVKGEIEKAISSLKIKSIFIYRPGLLIGERKEKRTGEAIAIQVFHGLQKIFSQDTLKTLGTEIRDLSERMLVESKKYSEGIKIFKATEI